MHVSHDAAADQLDKPVGTDDLRSGLFCCA